MAENRTRRGVIGSQSSGRPQPGTHPANAAKLAFRNKAATKISRNDSVSIRVRSVGKKSDTLTHHDWTINHHKASPEYEAVESEIKYLQKYFNIHIDPMTGAIQDDKNLHLFLTLMYRTLQNEISTEEILLSALRRSVTETENPGKPNDLCKPQSSGRPSQHRALDPNFVEKLPSIFDEISQLGGKGGKDALKLLCFLSCLANEPVDAKLCIYLMYGDDSMMNTLLREPQFTRPSIPLTKCQGDMRLMLALLERYSLITLKIETPAATEPDRVEEKKEEKRHLYLVNHFVQLNPIVYNYVRKEGHIRHKQIKYPATLVPDAVVRLSKLLMGSRLPGHDRHMLCLHESLRGFGWQDTSYLYSLYFATALTTWFDLNDEAVKILDDVYRHLWAVKGSKKKSGEVEEDAVEECMVACKMALMYIKHYKVEGISENDWSVPDEEVLDSSSVFYQQDPLHAMTRLDHFDWVLNQVLEYYDDELVQYFGVQLLNVPLVICGLTLDQERREEVRNWTKQFAELRVQEAASGMINHVFTLLESPLTMMKIGTSVYPSLKIIQLSLDMARNSSSVDSHGKNQRSKFLQETFYLMNPSIILIWEQEELSRPHLTEMCDVCLMYIEHGMNCFIAMLTKLESMIRPDISLDSQILDFLETMKAVAYFNDCVILILESTEFIGILKKIFSKIVTTIENGGGGNNVKTLAHILVFWYSLLVAGSVWKFSKTTTASGERIKKEMINFHKQLTTPNSPLFNAFTGETEWDTYFREQDRTSERILDTFLSTSIANGIGVNNKDISELAEILKDVTKKS